MDVIVLFLFLFGVLRKSEKSELFSGFWNNAQELLLHTIWIAGLKFTEEFIFYGSKSENRSRKWGSNTTNLLYHVLV